MKKLLLILFVSLGLIGCSETAPQQVKFDDVSHQWKKWDCFAWGYGGDLVFTIGYIPELKRDGFTVGKLFLKDADSPIDTIYQMTGVQHHWNWEEFQITIDSTGEGRYYDFTGASEGEERTPKEAYECTSSEYVSFSKSFDSFFSY